MHAIQIELCIFFCFFCFLSMFHWCLSFEMIFLALSINIQRERESWRSLIVFYIPGCWVLTISISNLSSFYIHRSQARSYSISFRDIFSFLTLSLFFFFIVPFFSMFVIFIADWRLDIYAIMILLQSTLCHFLAFAFVFQHIKC